MSQNSTTTNTEFIYNTPVSKASIIQRLLDEKKITVEEAMILMKTEIEVVQIPNQQPALQPPFTPGLPYTPYIPESPGTPGTPFWYSTGTANLTKES